MLRLTSCLAVLLAMLVVRVGVGEAATPVHVDTITHGGVTITMDLVPVGNPGNAGDAQSQGTFGAVNYSYKIGKYEVTENQWDAVSGIAGDLLDNPGSWSGDQPVETISWHEAAMFCNWLTSGDVTDGAYTVDSSGEVTGIDRAGAVSAHGTAYVIPTENEWYKAAYYDADTSTYYDYPTGSDSVPDGIDHAGDATFDAVFGDPYHEGHPNDVDNAGVLSPYGTMGQGGNVLEWNETTIHSSHGLRGGGWFYGSNHLLASSRSYYAPPFEGVGPLGFRVASVPEPGSITLLLCGALAGLVWWRRRK